MNILGGTNPAYWLFVNPDKLAANQLTANEVLDAVQAQNTTAIGGLVGGPPASGDQAYTYRPLHLTSVVDLIGIEVLMIRNAISVYCRLACGRVDTL